MAISSICIFVNSKCFVQQEQPENKITANLHQAAVNYSQ
jgi:hypothetical protein